MSTLGLSFCGFEMGDIREAFASAFPDPREQYDLGKWASFEKGKLRRYTQIDFVIYLSIYIYIYMYIYIYTCIHLNT